MTAAYPRHGRRTPETVFDPDQEKKPRRRIGCFLLTGTAIVVILALIAAGAYLFSLRSAYNSNVTHFPSAEGQGGTVMPPDEGRPEATEATNILLMGTDANGGSGEEEELPRVPGGGRSDTMMLLHIPEDKDSMQVLSIPRDLWVEVPYGHGWHKINAALALASGEEEGPWLTIATVEHLLDTRIDHVAAVDMLGFIGLVEDMGGVDVNSGFPESFTTNDGYTFHPGTQQMNAEEALSFVRHRSTFPDGDLQRIRNQQAFIRGVISEAASASTLANPLQVNDMVSTLASHLVTDPDLDAGTAAGLAWDAREGIENIEFMTLPDGGSGYTDDGQWIFYQDEEAMGEISEHLHEGTLEEHIAAQ